MSIFVSDIYTVLSLLDTVIPISEACSPKRQGRKKSDIRRIFIFIVVFFYTFVIMLFRRDSSILGCKFLVAKETFFL